MLFGRKRAKKLEKKLQLCSVKVCPRIFSRMKKIISHWVLWTLTYRRFSKNFGWCPKSAEESEKKTNNSRKEVKPCWGWAFHLSQALFQVQLIPSESLTLDKNLNTSPGLRFFLASFVQSSPLKELPFLRVSASNLSIYFGSAMKTIRKSI